MEQLSKWKHARISTKYTWKRRLERAKVWEDLCPMIQKESKNRHQLDVEQTIFVILKLFGQFLCLIFISLFSLDFSCFHLVLGLKNKKMATKVVGSNKKDWGSNGLNLGENMQNSGINRKLTPKVMSNLGVSFRCHFTSEETDTENCKLTSNFRWHFFFEKN